MGVEVFHALKKVLGKMGLSTAVGDEGGFAPMLPSNEAALDVVMQAIESGRLRAGPRRRHRARRGGVGAVPGRRVRLQEGRRQPPVAPRRWWTSTPAGWTAIRSCRSRTGWPRTTGRAGRCSPSGCTSGSSSWATTSSSPTSTGWAAGIEEGVGNAVLVKVNQIGTLTETLQCIELAKGSAYGVIISHRSGETEDTFIADLAVATGAGQIKTGSASRTDRTAKYNQLLRIAEELGDLAHYPGRDLYPL